MLYYAVQRLSLTKNFHRDPDSIRKIYLSCFITSVPYYNKAERVTVRFSFSCTSLLYYILCLCKSFKELFPFRGANPSGTLLRSVPPCLRLQRYIGSGRFTSIGTTFLWIKRNFSFLSLYIYIARAIRFRDIRARNTVPGVVWDGERRKRFICLSKQYYFP